MATTQEFRLPDVGEGLTEAEIVVWRVEVGQRVAINDILVEIESAKSVVELPSPYEGVIDQILVEAGGTVEVGTVIVAIGAGVDAPTDLEPPADRPQVLVGPGPKDPNTRRRHLRPASPGNRRPARARTSVIASNDHTVATDNVRDLALSPLLRGPASLTLDREVRVPIRGVRKAMADAMVASAFTAPQVTEWLAVDVTATMSFVRRLRTEPGWADVRVTPLLFVARAFLLAIVDNPEINASWDESAQELVFKPHVNLGIAAATPRGLVVPNIKQADTMTLRELATQLDALVTTARAGHTQPAQMTGGTVTITNVGALGVDAATPILNPGESAILAVGNIRPQPWVVDGKVAICDVTHLAITFDHRFVDGELGSRVLARTAALLNDPSAALFYL